MPSLKSFPWSGSSRPVAVVCAMLLLGICINNSPVAAQSRSESVPPWQLPPDRQTSQYHASTVDRTAYDTEAENLPEGDEPPARTAPSDAMRSILEQSECGTGENCEDSCNENVSCYCPLKDRMWMRGEYLSMWSKSTGVPPLATTSATGTARSQSGILGLSSTRILFGNADTDYGSTPGARLNIGYWFNTCQDSGIEATYMFLGSKSVNLNASSDSNPILAVPFFNVQTNLQDALILAFPGQQTATMDVSLTNQLQSIEMLWRRAVLQDCNHRLDFLIGYRYGKFTEDLNSDGTSNYLTTVGLIPAGSRVRILDQFSTINDFHGAELGFSKNSRYSNFSLELLGKLAIGATRSTVTVNGATFITPPGGSVAASTGGLLAVPSNMGTFEQRSFSMIPELGMNVGYNFTSRLKATVGYSVLYWSRVARPTDQIDTNLNPSQLPPGPLSGIPSPQAKFISSDFWVQGLNIGLDYRY